MGWQPLKIMFFSFVLCEIKYVPSLLSYVPHAPSRPTCLTGSLALRAFALYAPSSFTHLHVFSSYAPCLCALSTRLTRLLYAPCSLYLRALRAFFMYLKIFCGSTCSPSKSFLFARDIKDTTNVLFLCGSKNSHETF